MTPETSINMNLEILLDIRRLLNKLPAFFSYGHFYARFFKQDGRKAV